jgi:hypothetical protein
MRKPRIFARSIAAAAKELDTEPAETTADG